MTLSSRWPQNGQVITHRHSPNCNCLKFNASAKETPQWPEERGAAERNALPFKLNFCTLGIVYESVANALTEGDIPQIPAAKASKDATCQPSWLHPFRSTLILG